MTKSGSLIKAASFAIATLGMAAFVTTVALPDAVYAKNGNGGGNGGGNGNGGGSGNGGGNGNGADKSGNGGSNKGGQGKSQGAAKSVKADKPAKPAAAAPVVKVKKKAIVDATYETPLHPSQKGKWNAANANQAALDAHIRNQNFNGTIGALSQYQLAAKAASGVELTEAEAAAIESLLGGGSYDVADQDLADLLNADTIDGDPVYSVNDGVVSCSENCDAADLEAAQDLADAEAERLAGDAEQQALDDLLSASEARIVNESNKPLSPEGTEQLLDELASTLGVTRAMPEIDDPVDELGEELAEVSEDELVEVPVEVIE